MCYTQAPAAAGFFAIGAIRPTFWAKTVSHCGDSSAFLGQKVAQECVIWRIHRRSSVSGPRYFFESASAFGSRMVARRREGSLRPGEPWILGRAAAPAEARGVAGVKLVVADAQGRCCKRAWTPSRRSRPHAALRGRMNNGGPTRQEIPDPRTPRPPPGAPPLCDLGTCLPRRHSTAKLHRRMECAPGAGQGQAAVLTVCRA
jgi:hypothetical protein